MTPEEQRNLEGELYASLNSYSQQLEGLKETAYQYGAIFAALGELLQLCPEYVLFDEAEFVDVKQFPMEKCHFEAGVFGCHAVLQDITSKIRAAILEVNRLEGLVKMGSKPYLGTAKA